MQPPPASLLRDVELLCLDAGNTVVFFDHERVARLCARAGFATTASALNSAEGATKVALDRGALRTFPWSGPGDAPSRSWGRFVGTLLHLAGLREEQVPSVLDALWEPHRTRNLWSLVPEGLGAALSEVRACGVRVAVVSNSEGRLESLLEEAGLLRSLDLVVDSGVVGVEKPDPRIFRLALDRFGAPPSHALHLGDTYGTDVVGARAAGIRAALVDPHGHLDGYYPDVPRVSGAVEVARALVRLA